MTTQPLIPPIGEKVHLADYDTRYRGDWDKATAREAFRDLQDRKKSLQEVLYADGRCALLIVLQAMDAGGKDGTIKNVFEGINPQGVKVANFKQPTSEELSHDFLWRVHRQAPPKGYIGIFNRSHYEDVLVVRVNQLVPEEDWRKRYDHINQFEKLLVDSGTHILKFFLHISKAEQKERFQDRLDRSDKQWKFSMGDLPVREQWDEYMAAYEDALTLCNTAHAPWHIVPADRKWYRNLVISRKIVEALEAMNLRYPTPAEGLDKVVIPD